MFKKQCVRLVIKEVHTISSIQREFDLGKETLKNDTNKTVLVDNVTSTYEGVGGHYSRVVVKVFPNTRSNADAITMPYAEYMQKVQNGTLQQELEQHFKEA